MREHENVIIQTVTYRPVWPAVSAPDYYCNVYLQCVFTDVTQIKITYLLTIHKLPYMMVIGFPIGPGWFS